MRNDWFERRAEEGTLTERELQMLMDGEVTRALDADHWDHRAKRAKMPRDVRDRDDKR